MSANDDVCIINDLYRNTLILTFHDFITNTESFTQRFYFSYFRKLSDPKLTPNPVYYYQYKVYEKYFPEIRLMIDANSFPKEELQSFVYQNFDKLILRLHWLNFAHVHVMPVVQFIYEKFDRRLILPVMQQLAELVNNYDFVTDDVLHLIMRWCNIHTMTLKLKIAEVLYDDLNDPQIVENSDARKQLQKELRKLFKISGYNGDETIDEFMQKQIMEKLIKIKEMIDVSMV
jgi:hypothetical protein